MSKFQLLLFAVSFAAVASAGETIKLPPPQKDGGPGIFSVLAQRRSQRAFSMVGLSQQELSNLLWSGFGISGPGARRTAPSAVNRQEYTLYALLADGAYKYLPESCSLEKIADEDLRRLAAGNVTAPAYILLVADLDKAASPEYAAIDAGYISQNLYLAATAQGLGSCALGGFRRNADNIAKLKAKLKLGEAERPMLSQAVGKIK